MARDIRQIEKELSALSQKDRAALARSLIDSLDDDPEDGVLTAWVEEAHARYAAYKAGRLSSVSADEAFAKARNKLP